MSTRSIIMRTSLATVIASIFRVLVANIEEYFVRPLYSSFVLTETYCVVFSKRVIYKYILNTKYDTLSLQHTSQFSHSKESDGNADEKITEGNTPMRKQEASKYDSKESQRDPMKQKVFRLMNKKRRQVEF
jgi:hypothetical protein